MPRLPDEKNPYSGSTPFDILGLTPSASSREILQARDEKLEDLDYSHEGEERIRERQRIMRAYEQLNDARTRVGVEMFFFDESVGKAEVVEAARAEQDKKPNVWPVLEVDADVFPTSPAIDHAGTQGRKLKLSRCSQLSGRARPASDPTDLVRRSIRFDT